MDDAPTRRDYDLARRECLAMGASEDDVACMSYDQLARLRYRLNEEALLRAFGHHPRETHRFYGDDTPDMM